MGPVRYWARKKKYHMEIFQSYRNFYVNSAIIEHLPHADLCCVLTGTSATLYQADLASCPHGIYILDYLYNV